MNKYSSMEMVLTVEFLISKVILCSYYYVIFCYIIISSSSNKYYTMVTYAMYAAGLDWRRQRRRRFWKTGKIGKVFRRLFSIRITTTILQHYINNNFSINSHLFIKLNMTEVVKNSAIGRTNWKCCK